MQEYQVTVNGIRYELERPLFVPPRRIRSSRKARIRSEAQLDRFSSTW